MKTSRRLLRHLQSATDEHLDALLDAARESVQAFSATTQVSGSVLQSWLQGRQMVQFEHYPANDIIDWRSGCQFYYHAHRDGHREHGHVHLFWHATASGKRRRMSPGRRQWKKTAPTHLFAIALDPRGLPVGLFTVNRWVTDGFWFDAATTMSMVRRFRVATAEGHGDSSRWLTGFVQLYGPLIANLLEERDRRIARRPDLPSALEDRRLDLLSYLPIDWSADLDALESEVARRACLPGRAPFSEDISGERRCASQDWL